MVVKPKKDVNFAWCFPVCAPTIMLADGVYTYHYSLIYT